MAGPPVGKNSLQYLWAGMHSPAFRFDCLWWRRPNSMAGLSEWCATNQLGRRLLCYGDASVHVCVCVCVSIHVRVCARHFPLFSSTQSDTCVCVCVALSLARSLSRSLALSLSLSPPPLSLPTVQTVPWSLPTAQAVLLSTSLTTPYAHRTLVASQQDPHECAGGREKHEQRRTSMRMSVFTYICIHIYEWIYIHTGPKKLTQAVADLFHGRPARPQ